MNKNEAQLAEVRAHVMEQQVAEGAEAHRKLILSQTQTMIQLRTENLRQEEQHIVMKLQSDYNCAEAKIAENDRANKSEEAQVVQKLRSEFSKLYRNSELKSTELQQELKLRELRYQQDAGGNLSTAATYAISF